MARTLVTPIQQRFSDIDPFLHVNNVAQQMYFDTGKTTYYREVLGADVLSGDLRIVAVSTATDYLEQVRMHDDVAVTTVCERVGCKSIVLRQELRAGERLCSRSRSVMVAFDFASQQSVPVPDAWRRRMLE